MRLSWSLWRGGEDLTEPVKSIAPGPTQLTRSDPVKTVAESATLLFTNGQTTEQTVVAAERLGRALGVPLTLHPRWGELEIRVDGTLHSAIMPAAMKIIDQVCDGILPGVAARSALAAVGHMRPVSTLRFVLFAAIGAASM